MKNDLFEKIDQGRNIFITGQAGTGKTFLLGKIIEYLETTGKVVALTATTGFAGLAIGGTTINRFMGVGIKRNIDEWEEGFNTLYDWPYKSGKIKKTDILVIDEISMVSKEQIELFDYVAKRAKGNDKPFGGMQVIFSGDFLQLPPINNNGLAFESYVWDSLNLYTEYLTKIYRQDDLEFLKILNNIREGKSDSETISFINRCANNEPEIETVKLFARNDDANKCNNYHLDLIEDEEEVFTSDYYGNESDIETIKKSLIAEETLHLKVGARVMTIINEINDIYYNGSLGYVVEIGEKSVLVDFDNGETYWVDKYSWLLKDNETGEVIASVTQIPLKLAYAITIHKSQGMSIEALEIDCNGIFANNQFYVAMSRATNPKNLKVINFKPNMIRSDFKTIEFYRGLENKTIFS